MRESGWARSSRTGLQRLIPVLSYRADVVDSALQSAGRRRPIPEVMLRRWRSRGRTVHRLFEGVMQLLDDSFGAPFGTAMPIMSRYNVLEAKRGTVGDRQGADLAAKVSEHVHIFLILDEGVRATSEPTNTVDTAAAEPSRWDWIRRTNVRRHPPPIRVGEKVISAELDDGAGVSEALILPGVGLHVFDEFFGVLGWEILVVAITLVRPTRPMTNSKSSIASRSASANAGSWWWRQRR